MNRSFQRVLISATTIATLGVSSMTPAAALGAAATPTVLGLDSDDATSEKASALTSALRDALITRGFSAGVEMTLLELNLTMDCDGEDFDCLGSGGENLGATELLYGALRANGDGFILTLSLLEVESHVLKSTIRKAIDAKELASDEAIESLATSVVAEFWEEEDSPPPAAAPVDAEDEGEPEEVVEGPKENSRSWEWGKDPSPPAWKWAGVGVSAGLTAASLGTAITTALLVQGSVRDDLLNEADASLDDDNDSNDIDRSQLATDGVDLCSYAGEEIDPENEPGAVRNASVTKICNKGNALATTSTAAWIATGVFAVSTAVFTTLLFTRKKNDTAAMLMERGFSLGGAPLPGGGALVGGRIRF